ncbi:MAG TPA: galactokinase [Flavisolibacter sp.]|nr:galactokinase [Flavisolibacter sp.]
MSTDIALELKTKHNEKFGKEALIVRSPGRVNIIGEHTDYNDGFVLPAAINKAILVSINKRDDDTIHLFSDEFNQEHITKVAEVAPDDKQWPNYVLGVVDQLNKRGFKIQGFNLMFDGNVPIGSGLSSSAAVECATAFALNELFQLGIPKMQLAFIGQKAEHEFAKVMCGIMDQFASVFGKKDHVIKLDCKTLDYEYVPLKLDGYKIVLLNTNVKHSLASSEYNTRRAECGEGVAMIKEKHPGVESLRDVTIEMLNEIVQPENPLVYQRCKYVVEESQRLLEACDALKSGDIKTLGQKMYGSHDGLSKEYEVSCKELDFLVDAVRNNSQVLGARMMGGGFGGCTINIVEEGAVDSLIEKLSKEYKENMGKELTPYIAETADGSSIVENV